MAATPTLPRILRVELSAAVTFPRSHITLIDCQILIDTLSGTHSTIGQDTRVCMCVSTLSFYEGYATIPAYVCFRNRGARLSVVDYPPWLCSVVCRFNGSNIRIRNLAAGIDSSRIVR